MRLASVARTCAVRLIVNWKPTCDIFGRLRFSAISAARVSVSALSSTLGLVSAMIASGAVGVAP